MSSSPESSSYSVFKQDGSHQFYCRWTTQEDKLLSKAVADHGPHKWTLISQCIPGRTAVQCSTRWFGALNPNIHKGRWSSHEDQALTKAVKYFQNLSKSTVVLPWNRIAENIPHRTGIQCQARWTEALDPAVRKGRWHPAEDKLLGAAIAQYGRCWIRVASMIPTRTQRQCRTRWNQIHSQQLKATSAAEKALSSVNRNQSSLSISTISTADINLNFVSPLTSDILSSNNDFVDKSISPIFNTVPNSSFTSDDIFESFGSNENSLDSSLSTTSRASSYSSASSSYSPPASALFLAIPMTDEDHYPTNLLQHDMFPMRTDDSSCANHNNISSNDFLFSKASDFDFLIDYTLETQKLQ